MQIKLLFIIVFLIFSYFILDIINDYDINRNISLSEFKKENINTNNFKKESIKNPQGSLVWDIQDNWKEIPGNNFSLAVYQIIDAVYNTEISITQFPGDAGGY